MAGIGMDKLAHHTNDRVSVIEIIIISLILTSLVLLPVGVSKIPHGIQQVNVGQIGLPEKAVKELQNLLKP